MVMSNNNICRSFALIASTVLCLHNIFLPDKLNNISPMMITTEIQEEFDLLRQKQQELDDLRNEILMTTTTTTATITESNNNNNSSSQKKKMKQPIAVVEPKTSSIISQSNNELQEEDNDNDNNDDISILKQITLGKNLGSGKYTDTFEAIFDDDNPPINSKSNKEYVIKFTTGSNGTGPRQYYQNVTILSQEIIQRLSPHPSIPETLLFIPNISNPFKSGLLKFPFDQPNIHRRSRSRVPNAKMMSIEIVEKVILSSNYDDDNHHYLQIPPSKVYCYWRRLFEILHYAHTKNVILRDVQLFNTRINDEGEIILFDWNRGRIFEPNNITSKSKSLKFGHVFRGHKYFGNEVHEYDVDQLGSRIRDFVDDENTRWDKWDEKHNNVTNNNNNRKSNSKITSREDLKLLEALYKKMKGRKRPKPTLRWLLDNHDYFVKYNKSNNESSSSCILKW